MPGSGLPVTRSVLSAEALLATVAPQYVLGEPIRCTLLSVGQNDTYLLETTHGRSILRVYHAHRRTVSDISYELAVCRREGLS